MKRRDDKALVSIPDWDGDQHLFGATAYQEHRPTHSRLLGPDGQPLAYDYPRMGFDLTPRRKE